jgi:hypothetical protein
MQFSLVSCYFPHFRSNILNIILKHRQSVSSQNERPCITPVQTQVKLWPGGNRRFWTEQQQAFSEFFLLWMYSLIYFDYACMELHVRVYWRVGIKTTTKMMAEIVQQ